MSNTHTSTARTGTSQAEPASASGDALDSLGQFANPFRGTAVGDPWSSDSEQFEVADLHRQAFSTCVAAVDEVRHGHCSAGIVIHGAPGSGKTHLISRLRRRLIDTHRTPTLERLSQAFAYVGLATNAATLARHIRRTVATDLLRARGQAPNQFERMVIARLMEVAEGGGDIAHWWDYVLESRTDELPDLLQQLGSQEGLSPMFVAILKHLVMRAHRLDVAGWLRGDPLTDAAYERLGIASDSVDEDPEEQAYIVLGDFMKLAGSQVPLVLCFDQIEALQSRPDDKEAFYRYGTLVSRLYDADTNLVIISCLQTSRYGLLHEAVPKYAMDRLQSRSAITLSSLASSLASQLLECRLRKSGIADLRPAGAAETWPFTDKDVATFVGAKGCTPRELLDRAATRFDLLTGSKAPAVQTLDAWLADEWERRFDAAMHAGKAVSVPEILWHGIPLLVELAEPQWHVRSDPSKLVDYLTADPEGEGTVGIKILEDDGNKLAAQLRKLDGAKSPPFGKLVLLRDERRPISKNAAKTQQWLKSLEQKEAQYVGIIPEALAALDAVRRLLADAQSGDLAFHAETLAPKTVVEWLRQNLTGALKELADSLISPPGPTGTSSLIVERMQEVLLREKVMSVPSLAAELGVAETQVLESARGRTDLFGHVGGQPAVVFSCRLGSNASA